MKKCKSLSTVLAAVAILATMVLSAQPTPPEWAANATIYEMNVRQFSDEGTLAKAQEHLERIADMGIEIIWLMPIHPIGELNRKGTMGSYYAVRDYLEVNPSSRVQRNNYP